MIVPTLRLGLGLATCCLVLIGCAPAVRIASPPPHLSPVKCTEGNCKITIDVRDCATPGGIVLDKAFVDVDRPVNMFWEIRTEGYEFAEHGILFVQENAPKDQQQFEPKSIGGGKTFKVHNKKTAPGDYYYFVLIKGCAPLDPWVRNNS